MVNPNYKIIVDNKDISAVIDRHFISLTLQDEDGSKNDILSIVLNNESDNIEPPRTGVSMAVWLGYGDDLVAKGAFEVDEIISSGHPQTITIIAKGSRVNKSLKIQRDFTYQDITLGALVNRVAKRNDMTARISEFLKDINIRYTKQSAESDQSLLYRLSRNYDAKYKSIDGTILFYLKDDFNKVDGEALAPIFIDFSNIINYKISQTDRSKYNTVVAKFRDIDTAIVKQVRIGSDEPIFTMKEIYANQAEATERAKTKYNNLLRGRSRGSITIVGNAFVASEYKLIVSNAVRSLSGDFKIDSCTHNIGKNGYRTTAKLVRVINK